MAKQEFATLFVTAMRVATERVTSLEMPNMNMKKILALSAVFAVFASSDAQAARLRADTFDGDAGVVGIYLDGQELNGQFDTVIVDIRPNIGSFEEIDEDGVDGITPRPAGDPFTYINPFLSAPPAFGGNGFSVLGAETNPNRVAFTAGPLGMTIDTVNGPNVGDRGLFLANINLSVPFIGAGSATVDLVRAGTLIATLSEPFPVPEPATLAMAGLAMVGVSATRRRS